MIMVDVYVPALGQTYDFSLDEMARLKDITEELADMIGQKEQSELQGDVRGLLLCSGTDGRVLPSGSTLSACGIRNGYRLMLI
ncbi:MAG: EsaB/YukD family protein [Lachnospiraceae bacterium]|nr:EsaB/YukD family protein [Lachnospiraceae bacterium]